MPYSQTIFNTNHWLNRTLNAHKNKCNSQHMVKYKHCFNFNRTLACLETHYKGLKRRKYSSEPGLLGRVYFTLKNGRIYMFRPTLRKKIANMAKIVQNQYVEQGLF